MRPWRAILAASIIFLAGVASGALATRLYSTVQKPQAPPIIGPPPTPWIAQRMDFIRRMGPKLDLSKEQQEKLDSILHESQQRMRKLWEPLAPQAQAEMADVRKRIDAVLTSVQHERFEKLLKERPAHPTPGETLGKRRREARGDATLPQSSPPQGTAPAGTTPPPPTEAPASQQAPPKR